MKKRKPCLKCDKKIWTTPESRLCSKCNALNKALLQGQVECQVLVGTRFNMPKNTRGAA